MGRQRPKEIRRQLQSSRLKHQQTLSNTLGADAPPACYDDVMQADCLFIAGSNAAYAHPVLFRRIEDARAKNPNLKIIVADPRRTDTASSADLHLALQPGSDVTLFHGMLHVMLAEGWLDNAYIAAHTEGFDALQNLVVEYTAARVHDVCGITPEQLLQATRWFAGIPDHNTANTPNPAWRTLSLYCQGLNQSSSGTAKNASLINLHLATGQIGKAGAGPFSLTGQALLQTQASTQAYGRRLLMTGSKPPVPLVDAGNTVCSCVGVKDIAIHNHLKIYKGDSAQRLASLQGTLKCGTQCGSCVPELRRMIQLTESTT